MIIADVDALTRKRGILIIIPDAAREILAGDLLSCIIRSK
jgi:hypothetical protein